jgi:hypothetical protein
MYPYMIITAGVCGPVGDWIDRCRALLSIQPSHSDDACNKQSARSRKSGDHGGVVHCEVKHHRNYSPLLCRIGRCHKCNDSGNLEEGKYWGRAGPEDGPDELRHMPTSSEPRRSQLLKAAEVTPDFGTSSKQ